MEFKYMKAIFECQGNSRDIRETTREAPRPQGGASRRGSFVHSVPLDPACKAGLAGHFPVTA